MKGKNITECCCWRWSSVSGWHWHHPSHWVRLLPMQSSRHPGELLLVGIMIKTAIMTMMMLAIMTICFLQGTSRPSHYHVLWDDNRLRAMASSHHHPNHYDDDHHPNHYDTPLSALVAHGLYGYFCHPFQYGQSPVQILITSQINLHHSFQVWSGRATTTDLPALPHLRPLHKVEIVMLKPWFTTYIDCIN